MNVKRNPKRYHIPWYFLLIFALIFVGSVILNIKFILFPEQTLLKNIPVGGIIEENNSLEIVVKGFGENREGFRERFRVSNSDQMKIVDENNQSISFEDLLPGMYVEIRLWHDGTIHQDMDWIPMVTRIICSETKEGLDGNLY